MDSRTSFGVLLVIAGLFGMWLLVTNKLSKLLAPAQAAANSASSASSAPASKTTSYDPMQPVGTGSQAYGVRIGGDGLAIEPLGGVRVLTS